MPIKQMFIPRIIKKLNKFNFEYTILKTLLNNCVKYLNGSLTVY